MLDEAKIVPRLTDNALIDIPSIRADSAGVKLRAAGYEDEEGELELLIKACKRGYGVIEISIITPRYADGRPSSHFLPVRDTWLICRTFLQAFFWR